MYYYYYHFSACRHYVCPSQKDKDLWLFRNSNLWLQSALKFIWNFRSRSGRSCQSAKVFSQIWQKKLKFFFDFWISLTLKLYTRLNISFFGPYMTLARAVKTKLVKFGKKLKIFFRFLKIYINEAKRFVLWFYTKKGTAYKLYRVYCDF